MYKISCIILLSTVPSFCSFRHFVPTIFDSLDAGGSGGVVRHRHGQSTLQCVILIITTAAAAATTTPGFNSHARRDRQPHLFVIIFVQIIATNQTISSSRKGTRMHSSAAATTL